MPPCVDSIRNSLPPSAAGSHPMPAFCVQPNRSPDGRSRSISAVSGSAPAGPARACGAHRTIGDRRVERIHMSKATWSYSYCQRPPRTSRSRGVSMIGSIVRLRSCFSRSSSLHRRLQRRGPASSSADVCHLQQRCAGLRRRTGIHAGCSWGAAATGSSAFRRSSTGSESGRDRTGQRIRID